MIALNRCIGSRPAKVHQDGKLSYKACFPVGFPDVMTHRMIYERAATLLEADFGNELVALDTNAGECFGFNEVATSVWRLLERPRSLQELRKDLLEEYDVGLEECTQDLIELLDDLIARGLIRMR